MEAILTSTPKNGKNVWDNQSDYEDYLLENDGIALTWEVKHTAKTSEKILMYNYLFGPVMTCAVIGFTQEGWEGIDRVKARYLLQAEFGKVDVVNKKTGEISVSFEDIAKMPKLRLLEFIKQCLFYLEEHLHQRVPDSEAYKNMILTGKAFKSTKYIKK